MDLNKESLLSRLSQCRISDRFRLRKRIDRVNAENSEELQKLDEAVAASAAQVEMLQQLTAKNPVVYPDLPVSDRREEILNAVRDHQVVVIAGETGSGKTTQLPKMCLELGLGCFGRIGHTQPRRLAARTVASRIAEELGTTLGERVGYQVRFHDQVSEQTQIKVMTDGILLAETQNDRFLEQYDLLIIDEAHERSLNIDFLLGYIKNILPKRPDLKLVITSATIDVERFSQHFGDAPIIEVSGRTYPVDILYRPLHLTEDEDTRALDLQEGILAALDELQQIDRKKNGGGPGDVLVFLPGEREIRETAETLRKAQLRDTEVIPLYARLSLKEQNRVFEDQRKAGRRVVLSTNVAETSLTVPGIRYVIDPGTARISRYSYRSKVQRLPIEAVSQASANQRAGRCGRVAPGVCIRLYSEEDFATRPEFTDAEIRRTNLAAVILQMLQLKLGDILKFPFVDPPDSRFVNDGYTLLEELGGVDKKRHLTPIGRSLAKLPVDPRIGRMVLEANEKGALREVLVIASALSVQDPRERPHDRKQAADEKHKQYADEDSDFITLLNLWNLVEEQREELSQNQLRKWCQKNFISFIRLREWRDVHRQLYLTLKEMKLALNIEPAEYTEIHQSLLAGLLSHIGTINEKGEYFGARNRRFRIFPGSGLFKRNPKWVMAAELIETSKLYAHQVAKIQPEWIEPLALHLVKRSYSEPHWEKKRSQVIALEQVTLYGLIIVPARKVHYGPIDTAASHEIFIRSALVEGLYRTQAPYFRHNQNLLEQVEELEAKSRRRDLKVDDEALYEFYAKRLADLNGAEIVNGAGFERWRKKVERDNLQALFLTEEDVLQRSAQHVSDFDYPDQIEQNGARLKLDYTFEPAAKEDGVSMDCPLPLLKSLPEQRVAWLVPGLLQEKVAAILKGLPKQERKNFVPVPQYAEAFCKQVTFGEGDLYEQLAHQLLRMTGHRVDVELLKQSTVPDHLRLNIRLLDQEGKLLAQSRDWTELTTRFGHQAEAALQNAGDNQEWGQKHLTRWSFGSIGQCIETEHVAGLRVQAWPGLIDQGNDVELRLFSSEYDAQRSSRLGVARLVALALPEQLKYVRRSLPKLNEAVMLAGKRFNKRDLEDQVVTSAILRIIDQQNEAVVSASQFDALVLQVKENLTPVAEEVMQQVYEMHGALHRINKQLSGRIDLAAVSVLNDIRAQLDRLMTSDYLTQVPFEWLQHYPRYLKGIEVRLEKYQRELRQQTLLSDQLDKFYLEGEQVVRQAKARNEMNKERADYRWWLEEYRISLFAQQLGTLFTVSEKRLRKYLSQIATA